jgi:hypothetical protein
MTTTMTKAALRTSTSSFSKSCLVPGWLHEHNMRRQRTVNGNRLPWRRVSIRRNMHESNLFLSVPCQFFCRLLVVFTVKVNNTCIIFGGPPHVNVV